MNDLRNNRNFIVQEFIMKITFPQFIMSYFNQSSHINNIL